MDRKITKIDTLPQLERKTRVAAYARVSSGKDSMLHSLSAQVSYYNKYIASEPNWEFAGVYSDEAMTGTKDNREGFQRMLTDARNGKIDMIITKAISRFARNTVTLLETVRELKSIGVDVYFEEQNIHTQSNEGEMILTFLASFAQEESRSVSENMKWRIKKDFKEGTIWGNGDCYGYKLVDKKLVVVPEQAELVKRIFDMYIEGYGAEKIGKILDDEGVKPMIAKRWGKASIMCVLKNPNYTGDLILQKTYTEDHISKKTKRNDGKLDQYLVENDHEPIISKEIYLRAQEIRNERILYYKLENREIIKYPLSAKIKCAMCGATYMHKTIHGKCYWICSTYNRIGKNACASKQVPENEVNEAVIEILGSNDLIDDKLNFIGVHPGNLLVFHLKDGTTKDYTWKDPSRKNSWTPEMKEKARLRTLEQYRKERKKNGKDSNDNTFKD